MSRALRDLINFRQTVGKAQRIKQDPEKQPRSKQFGITAIICSLFIPAFAALTNMFFLFQDNFIMFIFVGLILGLILGLAGTLIMFLQTLKCFLLQLYINRKPVTWVALAFLIAATVAAAVILYFAFT